MASTHDYGTFEQYKGYIGGAVGVTLVAAIIDSLTTNVSFIGAIVTLLILAGLFAFLYYTFNSPKDSFTNSKAFIGIAGIVAVLAGVFDYFSTPTEEEALAAAEAKKAQAVAELEAVVSPEDNLKPIENIAVVDKNAPAAPARSGAEVYQAACLACHAAGVLDAPKLESGAWDSRVDKGVDGLVQTAISGINSMPPRGGNPDVTDEELKNAIEYMLSESGYDLAALSGGSGDAATAQSEEGSGTAKVVAAAAAAGAAAVAAVATKGAEASESQEEATATAEEAKAEESSATDAAAESAQSEATETTETAEQATATQMAAVEGTEATSAGKQVYESTCFTCHDVGINNSPMFGDNGVWSQLASNGVESLYNSALNGKGAMPPKGGVASLSKEQITAAVDYMLDAAGVSAAEAEASESASSEQAEAEKAEDTSTEQAETEKSEDTAAEAETKQATEETTETTEAATQEGTETTEQAVAPAQASIDGEKVYRGICFSCHDMGIAEAPKPGDKAVWEPRIAAGMEALYANSINGKGVMPAKGGNPALTDDEIKAAVDWMVEQSK